VEELLRGAADRVARVLRELPHRPVATPARGSERLLGLSPTLPDKPLGDDELLALLDDALADPAVAWGAARYFGAEPAGTLPSALAAHWLRTSTGDGPGGSPLTPGVVALRWLTDLFGLPAGTAGAVVRDRLTATVTALAAARYRVLAEVGWDVAAQGLFGAPPLTVVAGDQIHPDLPRALRLLGLGADRVYRVRVDGQGRIRPTLIPPLRPPAIVCVQLGGVDTGALDPVAAVCAEVHDWDAWVHVDGGYGLWAAAGPLTRQRVVGVGYADSWTADAGAALNVPDHGGLVFARDGDALAAALDLGRPSDGVEVFAALAALGRGGVGELIERSCRYARRFAAVLSAAGYRVLNEVALNRVLVDFGGPTRTAQVVARLQADGVCWCDSTVWQGRAAMRITVTNWCTSEDDVIRSLAAIRAAASRPAR